MFTISLAKKQDIAALNEIYNYEVLNGVATFDTKERSLLEAQKWFAEHSTPAHPLFAVKSEEQCVAYCSLSTYYDKDAYENTVEISLYVHPLHRSKGIGSFALEHVLNYAKTSTGIHNIIAVITSSNSASINLFKKFGFIDGGTIEEAGQKFGRMLGITNLYKLL